MAHEQYFIVFENNEWKISFNNKFYGPYPNQQEATDAAVYAAHAMGEIGIDAQVLIQDRDNAFREKWTYGKDYNLLEW